MIARACVAPLRWVAYDWDQEKKEQLARDSVMFTAIGAP
jgi:hypothetical protein